MSKLPKVVSQDAALGTRVISYMRNHMAMSDWDTDHEQNWIAGHMANFGRLERRRIRRLVAPHLLTVLSAVGHLTVANNRDAANRLMAAWANLKAATKAPRKARKGK